jgi:hypothetical protein
MSFWDDLNSFLGAKPQQSPTSNWNDLLGATAFDQPTPLIEGIQPESTAPIMGTDPTQSKYYSSTDDINRLVQLNPQPFQTIDVVPSDFATPGTNSCVVDTSILSKLFGLEARTNLNTVDIASSWRTIQVNIPGTFLKFDYLGAGINAIVGPTAAGVHPSSTEVARFFPYLSGQSTILSQSGQNQQRNYLIQFGSSKSAPLIIRGGDSFECPFSTIFISFKALGAPFRLTIGQKSIQRSASDNRPMNANISFGPGFGLWEDASYHPVPFTFTGDNFQNTAMDPNVTVNATTKIYNMITNSTNAVASNGVVCPIGDAILWITEVQFISNWDGSTNSKPNYLLGVLNTGTSAMTRTIYEVSTNVASGPPVASWVFNPSFPSRVSLKAGENLTLVIQNAGSSQKLGWMVKGYIVGGLQPTQTGQSYTIFAGAPNLISNRNLLSEGISGVGAFPVVCFNMPPFPNDQIISF